MSGAGFFLIVIAFGFLYFVMVRPQKKRQVAQMRMLNELAVGDEVVTAGGIYGEIVGLGEEDVTVRIAPQLDVRVARRAIAGITSEPEPGEADEPEEPQDDGDGAYEFALLRIEVHVNDVVRERLRILLVAVEAAAHSSSPSSS